VLVPLLGISFHRAGLPSSTRIRRGVSCVVPCESSSTRVPSGHGARLLSECSFSHLGDLRSDTAGRHRSPVRICFCCHVDSSLAACFSRKSLWHIWPAWQCLLLVWNASEGTQLRLVVRVCGSDLVVTNLFFLVSVSTAGDNPGCVLELSNQKAQGF
jgi:hypothetical protein